MAGASIRRVGRHFHPHAILTARTYLACPGAPKGPPTLWSAAEARAGLTDVARRADIVFAGDAEADLLVDADGSDPLPRIAALGPTQVLLKQGERGAVALIDGERLHQPAVPVSVVDPVGAGDAFVAGYLAGLLEGRPPRLRLEVAAIAGAYAVSGSGDWESLPRDSELTLLGTAENVRR